jgi:HAD superfamily hydrolase (TIGR01549 family)
MDINLAKRLIDQKKIISFDIFDTLLERKVQNPEQVYTLLKDHLVLKYGQIMNNYVEIRKHSYYLALNSQKCFGKEDVTLEKICEYAAKFYSEIKISQKDLLDAEEQVERMLLKRKQIGHEIYSYCVEKEKRIFFTSDMHLSREFLIDTVKSHGYEIFDNLYVSGDVGLLKHNAKLFEWILMENDLDLDDVLHIGDNIHTDYNMPRSVGLEALHLCDVPEIGSVDHMACTRSAVRATENIPSGIAASLYSKYLKQTKNHKELKEDEKYFYMLGLSFIGPICHYMCNAIRDDMEKKKISKILFFSRDGHIVYKCFKTLYPEIECEYVYASRRMTCYTVGMLKKEKYINDYMHGVLKEHTLQEALSVLPCNIVKLFKKQYIQNTERTFCCSKVKKILKKFLNDHFDQIKSSYQEQFDDVSNYYLDRCKGHERIAIFDLGWRGNMQIGFEKILSKSGLKISTYGYYFGLLYDALNSLQKNNWTGFFVYLDKPQSMHEALFNGTPVMEFLFSTDHPSVAGVKKSAETGAYEPIYEKQLLNDDFNQMYHRLVHMGANDFTKVFVDNYQSLSFNNIVTIETMIDMIRSFLLRPKRLDGQMFALASMSSGINQSVTRPIVDYQSKHNNPRKLHNSKKNSLWKEGFEACMNKKRKRLINIYSFIRNL